MNPISERFESRTSNPASSAIRSVVGTTEVLTASGGKHVARAPHRVQKRLFESLVQLSAKPADVDVDHVGAGIEVVVPDLLEEHCAGNHPAFVAGEIFEQQIFARLE